MIAVHPSQVCLLPELRLEPAPWLDIARATRLEDAMVPSSGHSLDFVLPTAGLCDPDLERA